jgi:hypothetical protein
MDGVQTWIRRRARLGLRGMVILLLVLAAGLAVLRPIVREPLGRFERYARVKLNERDLYRHLNEGRGVAEEFAKALRSGRLADVGELSTADLRERTTGHGRYFGLNWSPLARRSSELVEGVLGFSDERGRFVSRYTFRCGGGDRVSLYLVTESGRLKVERVEPEESVGGDSP